MLIQAYDEEDGDMAVRALNSPFIRHMDVEYSKLARSLPVPKCSQVRKALYMAGNVGDMVIMGIGEKI